MIPETRKSWRALSVLRADERNNDVAPALTTQRVLYRLHSCRQVKGYLMPRRVVAHWVNDRGLSKQTEELEQSRKTPSTEARSAIHTVTRHPTRRSPRGNRVVIFGFLFTGLIRRGRLVFLFEPSNVRTAPHDSPTTGTRNFFGEISVVIPSVENSLERTAE